MIFPANGAVLNLLGGRELTCFHCTDSCFVSESQWWIHVLSLVTIRDKTWSALAVRRANSSEHISMRNNFWTGISKHGTHLAQTLQMFMHINVTAIQHADFPGYLLDLQSSIAHHQCFDGTAIVIHGRLNWLSSSGVIFRWCSPMFKFSNASGDDCMSWDNH